MSTQVSTRVSRCRDAAGEFARRAREQLGDKVQAIVLFGSVARGEPRKDSDIDVLVVMPEARASNRDLWDIAAGVDEDNDYRTVVSVLEMTPASLESLRVGGFPIAGDLIEEGDVLYDDGTFQAWKDRGMTQTPGDEYTRSRLSLAAEMLHHTKLLMDADAWTSAADRVYYAMLHSVEAALAMYGVRPARTHDGIRSQLGEHLVRTSVLPTHFSRAFTNAFKLRVEATYKGSQIEPEAVQDMLQIAEEMVQSVREMGQGRGL